MTEKLLKDKKWKVAPKKANGRAGSPCPPQKIVLVGTYREGQLAWIGKHLLYNYPVREGDKFDAPEVITRVADFGGRSAKVRKAIEQYEKDGKFASLSNLLYLKFILVNLLNTQKGEMKWRLSA